MAESWVKVRGVIRHGHGVASGAASDSPYPRGTLEMQFPFFKACGLDLTSYHRGTLNLVIAPHTFAMRNPRYTFRRVEWTNLHPPEDFSFSRCRLIAHGEQYDGWVYYPHPETKIRHFQEPSMIEIIAPFIPGLKSGDVLELHLNSREISIDPPTSEPL